LGKGKNDSKTTEKLEYTAQKVASRSRVAADVLKSDKADQQPFSATSQRSKEGTDPQEK
jgi:hypothetical protein